MRSKCTNDCFRSLSRKNSSKLSLFLSFCRCLVPFYILLIYFRYFVNFIYMHHCLTLSVFCFWYGSSRMGRNCCQNHSRRRRKPKRALELEAVRRGLLCDLHGYLRDRRQTRLVDCLEKLKNKEERAATMHAVQVLAEEYQNLGIVAEARLACTTKFRRKNLNLKSILQRRLSDLPYINLKSLQALKVLEIP